MDSTNPQTRISTSGAIGALFGDLQSDLKFSEDLSNQYKENLALIVNSPLLKKIIGRATDSEYLVCMNILGALRYSIFSLFIVGICVLSAGDDFIALCEQNISLPLKSPALSKCDNLQNGKENDQLIGCNLYLQLFSLLTIILYLCMMYITIVTMT